MKGAKGQEGWKVGRFTLWFIPAYYVEQLICPLNVLLIERPGS